MLGNNFFDTVGMDCKATRIYAAQMLYCCFGDCLVSNWAIAPAEILHWAIFQLIPLHYEVGNPRDTTAFPRGWGWGLKRYHLTQISFISICP